MIAMAMRSATAEAAVPAIIGEAVNITAFDEVVLVAELARAQALDQTT